ncbi:MAG: response regulator [Bacteroides sp.]|nr:response regulator [Bacteroides sp.]
MKLLIIDDNSAVRTTLKLLLSSEFDKVVTVGDPRLIPALIKDDAFDVVLLDMNFDSTKLDGREGLFWLERIKSIPDAPAVVLITAFGDVPLAVEAMKIGAEDFITKPWDNDELIEKLRCAVKKNSSDRSRNESVRNAIEIEKREMLQNNMTLDELKMTHIRKVIDQCGGNISAAAEKLDINRQTLYNLLKRK